MPELPEVETMRRGIAGIAGSTIIAAARLPCLRKPIRIEPRPAVLSRRLVGRRIEEVGRLGKRVVLRLDSQDRLIFEPRMTGLVLRADPPSVEHLRFRLDLSGGSIPHIWYWDRRGLGSVRLISERQLSEQLGAGRLGPDALALAAAELQLRLGNSRRAIKVALLDQRAVAGIGNLYASEILHLAGIHPGKRCDLLAPRHWQAIHARMLQVLHEAILHEGSTLSDGTYRNALNQAGGYQNQHRVYDRAGEACRQCQRTAIVRVVQAQRATFFCPSCQPKRSRKLSDQ
ncbi:MAG: DNA-formamidopyrimidine glycosylase family protein [Pirellulaceae bacterium]